MNIIETIILFLKQNWAFLLLLLAALCLAVTYIKTFLKKPLSEQIEKVKAWLLIAVTSAEKEYGAGTGAIKLAYVYSMFIEKFPAVANLISFDTFSLLVDEVLDKFKTMLNSNINLKTYVQGQKNINE